MKKSKKLTVWIISLVAVVVITVLIIGRDGFKKGASDAWKGDYDPPSKSESVE